MVGGNNPHPLGRQPEKQPGTVPFRPSSAAHYPSEPKDRAKGGLQVVVGSVVDIDLVSSLQTQTKRTPESLDSAARVNGEFRRAVSNVIEGIVETRPHTGV